MNQRELPSLLPQSQSWPVGCWLYFDIDINTMCCRMQHPKQTSMLTITTSLWLHICENSKYVQIIWLVISTILVCNLFRKMYKNSTMAMISSSAIYPTFLHNTQKNYTTPFHDIIEVKCFDKYCIDMIME